LVSEAAMRTRGAQGAMARSDGRTKGAVPQGGLGVSWSAQAARPAGLRESADGDVADELEAGRGEPLSASQRAFFEPLFGASFDRVRVHAGGEAAGAASALRARAYTLGEQIVWGRRDPEPASGQANRLLAHELAHVVQQRGGAGLRIGTTADVEQDAERSAALVSSGQPARLQAAAPASSPLLQPEDSQSGSSAAAGPATAPGAPTPAQVGYLPPGQQEGGREWTMQGFATDSAALRPEHEATVADIAADLNASGLGMGGYVTIVGHADSRGTEAHNQDLGQQRADRVKERLLSLITDPAVAAEVRAYSTGASDNDRPGDVAEYRQVTVKVTRRELAPTPLPPSSPGPSPQAPWRAPPMNPAPGLPPGYNFPRNDGPLAPRAPSLPPGFWTLPPPRPASPEFLNELSRLISDKFGRGSIASLGAKIAKAFGYDELQVRRDLNQALIDGGEEGLKAALKELLKKASPPVEPQSNPYGPATNEIPFPSTYGPKIPF